MADITPTLQTGSPLKQITYAWTGLSDLSTADDYLEFHVPRPAYLWFGTNAGDVSTTNGGLEVWRLNPDGTRALAATTIGSHAAIGQLQALIEDDDGRPIVLPAGTYFFGNFTADQDYTALYIYAITAT